MIINDFENIILSNRYKLVEEIGSGGMAYVYKAVDMRLNRNVAIKLLKTEYTKNEDFVQRFSFEAMSAARLTHINIVSIYDAGHENGLFYIVMELVEGITLKDLIDKKKKIKWNDSLLIVKQILSALDFAHKNKIVHRDIKPHNIIITYDGVAKIADFGIAGVISGNTRQVTNVNIGSVHYFSPEHAKGEAVDDRADIYSLGITLFEMLIGMVPFDGDTAVAVAMKNIQEPLVPPHEINQEIPIGISDLVVKATAKNPEDRFQSAVDMAAALQVVTLIPNEHLNYSSSYIKPKNVNGNRIKKKKNPFIDFVTNNYRESIIAAVAFFLAIIVFIVSFGTVSRNLKDYRLEEYMVIDFIGQNFDEVSSQLKKLGINVGEQVLEVSDAYEKGKIIGQSKPQGSMIKPSLENDDNEDNKIIFYVSQGNSHFTIQKDYGNPSVEERIVRQDFYNTGVFLENIYVYNANVAKDYVIATRPGEGEVLNAGDTLYIYISQGSPANIIRAENYLNMTYGQAKTKIENYGLKLEYKAVIPDEPDPGESANQGNNPINSSPAGLTTSNGPGSSPAPTPAPVTPKVQAQYPPAGTIMKPGETITIYMSKPEKYRTSVVSQFREISGMPLNEIFNLTIECTPSDTGMKEVIEDNWQWDKERMPYNFYVPVPHRGNTLVEIKVDGKFYCRYLVESKNK